MAGVRTHSTLRTLILLLGVVSCEHTEPFQASPPPPISGPLARTFPTRLTYNLGADAYPTWVPDGSAILYQAEDPNDPNRDRCLFALPPTGGTQTPVACADSVSLNVSYGPAGVSSAGRVAVYESVSGLGAGTPLSAGMYLTADWPFRSARLILPLPIVTPGGRADKLTSLHWLGDTAFLALGVRTTVASRCVFPCPPGIVPDTLETGLQVLLVRVAGDTAAVSAVPGTVRASSYSFVAPDTVYFTLNNDNRLLRTRIAGGAIDSMFAFLPDSNVAPPGNRTASPAVARGVQVTGHTAFAVIGGRLDYYPDSGLGEAQRDWGGHMHKVDLTTGTDSVLDYMPPLGLGFTYAWMRNPVLSPDGKTLTAEARVATLTNLYCCPPTYLNWIGTDTAMPPTGNIWQYVRP